MDRKIVQDVTLKRSIRNVPLPSRRNETASERLERTAEEKAPKKEPGRKVPMKKPEPSFYRGGKKKRNHTTWIVAVLAFVILCIVLTTSLSSAEVRYTPRSEEVTVSGTYVLQSGEGSSDVIPYTIMNVSKEVEETLPSSGTRETETKASGTLIIYNKGTEAQQLVERTRFESATGKIYRIQKSIVVPARTIVAGKETPGSIEAIVVAEEAGVDYNLSLSALKGDFTVPGLKGTPRFALVYARQKTDISGGFKGQMPVPNEADVTKKRTELRNKLREDLLAAATAQIPEGYLAFESLRSLQFESLPLETVDASNAKVKERADYYAILIAEKDLAAGLGGIYRDAVLKGEMYAINLEDLIVEPKGSIDSAILTKSEITLSVQGKPQYVYGINEAQLVSALAGVKSGSIQSILRDFPNVKTADITIKPFWKRTLPDSPSKITLLKEIGD